MGRKDSLPMVASRLVAPVPHPDLPAEKKQNGGFPDIPEVHPP